MRVWSIRTTWSLFTDLSTENWGDQDGDEFGLVTWNEMHCARFERSPHVAADAHVQFS
jgi:hypothetical protein